MIIDVTGKLRINLKAREWCMLPYPGHPLGCPNYGQRKECPPQAPLIGDFADLNQPHFFAIVAFNLEHHMQRMWASHPGWSVAQARCVLYWQGTVRSQLTELAEAFRFTHPGMIYTLIPEAMGVNVIVTAWNLNVPIELKPIRIVHKVALLAYPKGVRSDG